MIYDGQLQPGDRLPTEAELGRSARVSRTVVREAVASLKAEALVETRQGAGAFVLAPASRFLRHQKIEGTTITDILNILELRLAVEVEAAALAARRHTKADLKSMAIALEDFLSARKHHADALEADLRFHLALANATRNSRFAQFLTSLGEFALPRRHLPDAMRDDAYLGGQIDLAAQEHKAILDAVRARDTALASLSMRVHLGGSRARYAALQSGS
jgi:DNA-binding FadR family transcriptional regulator